MKPKTHSTYESGRPQTVHFGVGALEGLEALSRRLALGRVLVVTSPSLVEKTSVVEKVRATLTEPRIAAVYSGCKEHTPIETVEEAYRLAVEYQVDGIVSVGGGSSIDTGKGVALALLNGSVELDNYVGSVSTYERMSVHASERSNGRVVPLLVVPTTLSAAEATRQAGITLRNGIKEQLYHPLIQAAGVVLDPALTLETPEALWLSTGIKALDHSVEVAYSRFTNDFAQGIAFNSIRLIYEHLPMSKEDPENLEHRAHLQVAAWSIIHAAVSTVTNVGLDHAIVHRLGGYYGIPHGIATCIMLPHVMEFNKPATIQEMALIATLGFGAQATSDEHAADEAVRSVDELIGGLGMPSNLRRYVEDRSTLKNISPLVLTDTAMAGNPRLSVTTEEIDEILNDAW